jgi:hypothetical protein
LAHLGLGLRYTLKTAMAPPVLDALPLLPHYAPLAPPLRMLRRSICIAMWSIPIHAAERRSRALSLRRR